LKITVVYGTSHKGSTYNITRLILEKLKDENTLIKEIHLPKDMPEICIGCFNCILRDEAKCPHRNFIKPIINALDEADLIILMSPNYVMNMSGAMKVMLDHLAFRWMSHRPAPEMFGKVGLVISTTAGMGANKVAKMLKENLLFWGVPVIYSLAYTVRASDWKEVNDKLKTKISKDVEKTAAKIKMSLGHLKPSFKAKFMYKMMLLNQKGNTWSELDRGHWEREGWLNGKKPWK